MRHEHALVVKKIDGHLRHHNFHDAFAVSGAGDAASFRVGITAAADERRIADASREFTASAASGGARGEISVAIDCHGAYRTVFVADVMFSGMRIFEAPAPGHAFALVHEFFGGAHRYTVFVGEFFRAGSNEHHVFTFFQDAARKANWVAHAFNSSDRPGFQRGAVHDDGIELDTTIAI